MNTVEFALVDQESFSFFLECCRAHALYEHANTLMDQVWAERMREFIFSSESALDVYVIECDGRPAGYLSLVQQFSTFDASKYLYLDCLFLTPECRGMGLGKQVMSKVQAIAVSLGCKFVEWQTPQTNEPAIRFYKKLGADSDLKARFRLSSTDGSAETTTY